LKSTVAEARNYTERIVDRTAKKDILRVLDGWEEIAEGTAFPNDWNADKQKTKMRERDENLEIYRGLSKR
jgi:hypothetical protein